MLTSHFDNLSTLYIPSLFWHAVSSRPDHATIYSRYCHVFEEKWKRSSCFCPKRVVKRKKKANCFDKDWADKHATSDTGSVDKPHEFEEGQDFEKAVIDGFLKPYKAFVKDQTARQQWRRRSKQVRGIRPASITWLGVFISLGSVVIALFPPLRIRFHMLFLVVFVPVTFFPFSFLWEFLTLFWPINNTNYQSEERKLRKLGWNTSNSTVTIYLRCERSTAIPGRTEMYHQIPMRNSIWHLVWSAFECYCYEINWAICL